MTVASVLSDEAVSSAVFSALVSVAVSEATSEEVSADEETEPAFPPHAVVPNASAIDRKIADNCLMFFFIMFSLF